MSKKSCEAAESIKDALLRMARVNCNFYLDLKGFLSMIIFKKLFAPIALLLCFTLSLSLTGCSASSAQPFSKTGFYFDTVISLTCYGNDAQAVLNEAFELCGHYENLLSYTKEGSDIWNINHANGQPVTVDSETASLLQTALYWSEKTDGLIDPTITPISQLWNFSGDPAGPVPKQSQINALLPHVDYHNIRIDGNTVTLADPDAQLDLGFLAKGAIADRLKAFFLQKNITSALINLGGNVLAVGQKPDGTAFRTGIKKPFSETNELVDIVALKDQSLVSSGNYERCFRENGVLYHHILDPRTGYPADTGLSSVTILSDSSTDGDALSTSCFLLGYEKGRELIDSLPDVEALFLLSDGTIYRTKGFPQS